MAAMAVGSTCLLVACPTSPSDTLPIASSHWAHRVAQHSNDPGEWDVNKPFEHVTRTLQVLRVAVQLALLDVVPCKLLHGLLDTFGLVGLIVER